MKRKEPIARRRLPPQSCRTISRRTLIEWLGKAAVLPLGTAALAACGAETRRRGLDRDGAAGDDGPGSDVAPGDAAGDDGGGTGDFPFHPGEAQGGIYRDWGVRTVDPQDLQAILASWKLGVGGMVESPFELAFDELVALPRRDQVTDFHCVEGWSVYDVPWNGVGLAELFDRAVVKTGATYVTFHTIGGEYNESLPLAVAREPRTMLAYGIAGSTLPLPHGFPLRLVVPRLLAYKNAKYVERIELTDHPVDGFWVAHGYPYDGDVPAKRLRDGKY